MEEEGLGFRVGEIMVRGVDQEKDSHSSFPFLQRRPQPPPLPPSLHTAPEGLSVPRADCALLGSPTPQSGVPDPGSGIQGPDDLVPICLPA